MQFPTKRHSLEFRGKTAFWLLALYFIPGFLSYIRFICKFLLTFLKFCGYCIYLFIFLSITVSVEDTYRQTGLTIIQIRGNLALIYHDGKRHMGDINPCCNTLYLFRTCVNKEERTNKQSFFTHLNFDISPMAHFKIKQNNVGSSLQVMVPVQGLCRTGPSCSVVALSLWWIHQGGRTYGAPWYTLTRTSDVIGTYLGKVKIQASEICVCDSTIEINTWDNPLFSWFVSIRILNSSFSNLI